jgi:signal transduction histidine kinase
MLRIMTYRDTAADAGCVVLSAGVGTLLLVTRYGAHTHGWVPGPGGLVAGVDAGLGAFACAAILLRRRWPVAVAVVTSLAAVLALSAGGASFVALCGLAIRRRTGVAVTVGCLSQLLMIPYYLIWLPRYPFWAVFGVSLTEHVAMLTLGMYIRARRQLIATLHERVSHAESMQRLLADQARHAERARIATEMHDVLAHRVSLMALQAGALEIRPDLPSATVRETAGLIRSTARQALNELRDVIGVLHSDEAAFEPQPVLSDISRLVGEYRQAGLNVALDMRVTAPESAPGPLGRDTYRIVREALTNVSKHARGTAATVSVSGRAGEGLTVTVRNKLPLTHQVAAMPGAGLGLVGLAERVALAGGTLSHGPDRDGDFVLTAALQWAA